MKRRTSLLPVMLVGIVVLLGLVLLAAQNGASQGAGQNKDEASKVPAPQETGVPCPVPSAEPSVVVPICEVPFTDVDHAASYFPGVQYVHCYGGVTGYNTNPPCTTGTPCFLPNTPMTRGQAAKLVSNVLLRSYQQLVEQFSDVPYGSPFFEVIGRLRSAGVVQGYDDNTFKPGDPISRGQFLKMAVTSLHLSLSYQWPMLNPVENTFEDVRRGNPLYSFVEMAAAHNAVTGYPCGGAGEPCGVGNKPYFRPNTILNRAQVSVFAFKLATTFERK